MGIHIYNNKTGKWEKSTSTLASGIKVLDVNGQFENEEKNVEKCLEQIKTEISSITKKVKDLDENGTSGSGGGGGGGGSAFPKITLVGDTFRKITTDESIDLQYFFQSPNYGRGKVSYSINNGPAETLEINQGKNKKTIKALKAGIYEIQFYVIDSAGLYSNYINIELKVGTLEITSTFDQSNNEKDFQLKEDIKIDYYLGAVDENDPITLTLSIDGDTTILENQNVGRGSWNVGNFTKTGVHYLTLSATNSTEKSNIIKYTILVTDGKNLYVASDFIQKEIDYGKKVIIDYRISMEGQTSFISEHYINGKKIDTMEATKSNFWNIGKLKPGTYKLKILCKTKGDNPYISELDFNIKIVSNNFIPMPKVTDMLLASFSSNGKNNNSETRHIWEDQSGNNVTCDLFGFNYSTSGWLEHQYFNNKVTALTFGGKAYAVIDLKPFEEDYPDGFTLDICYKVENVGNIESKVLDCRKKSAPFNGVYIGIEKTSIRTNNSTEADVKYPERIFVRQTYVIDKKKKLVKIYTNGTISALRVLSPNDNMLLKNNKIILGAEQLENGSIGNFSTSAIIGINIYKKALNNLEVLQNFASDIDDIDDQMKIRELNGLEIKDGKPYISTNMSIPTMTLIGDISKMDNVISSAMTVNYMDPNDPSKSFNKDGCLVKWQGTSSLQYPVKNYTLELKDSGEDFLYAPKDEWIPECRFTLKADFMESSHANNTGIANFVQDIYKKYLASNPIIEGFPPAKPNLADTKQHTRNTVDGFPIKLLIQTPDGTFDKGIYNFNLDRYSHRNFALFGETKAVSYEIAVNSKDGAGAFMDDSWDSIKQEFNYRYHNAGNETAVTVPDPLLQGERWLEKGKHNELEELVRWVKNTIDPEFTPQFFERFDAHYTLIYYIIVYSLGIIDNLGKNMVLTTWGKDDITGNTIWYPQFYDLDSALGLDNEGRMKYGPNVDMASGHFNTSDSLLWTKINKSPLLKAAISAIYKKLRFELKLLTIENFMKFYNTNAVEKIGARYYNEDIECKYAEKNGSHNSQYIYMCNGSRIEQTYRWLEERFIYLDSVYGSIENNKSVIFRANKASGKRTIRLKSYSPMWITVSFSDASGNKFRKYVDRDKWTEFTGTISSETDNNIYISGAKNLMNIDGLKQLNVASALIEEAERLIELDVSGSNYLRGVFLGKNRFLQKLKLNDCPLLGKETVNNVIDVTNCVNLKYLNIANTQVANLVLNGSGGALEYLNCANTKITSFTLINQEYLEEFNVNECNHLSFIDLKKCNSLTEVSSSNTGLITLNIDNCKKITDVDISENPRLEKVSLSNCISLNSLLLNECPKTKVLDISNTIISSLNINGTDNLITINGANSKLKELDLCSKFKLKTLYIPSSSLLKNLSLPSESILENINISGSALSSINLSNQMILKKINISDCNISELNLEQNINLISLDIANTNIGNLDLSKNRSISDLTLARIKSENSVLSILDLSNTNIESLDLKSGLGFKCPNLKILKVDNTSKLNFLSVSDKIISVSMKDSNITKTIWSFTPIFPTPLLLENNMANYTRATVNGSFLSSADVIKLKNNMLDLVDDSYIQIYDGILAGNIFFLDAQVSSIPETGVKIKEIFPDTVLSEHIKTLLGKKNINEKINKNDLEKITWLGKNYSFVSPEDYKGYFYGKRVKSFKGLDSLTKLRYLNLAGCDYDGSIKLELKEIERLDFSFADMPKLKNVTFSSNLEKLKSISYGFANSRRLESAIIPNAINVENASYAFLNCISLTDLIINFNNQAIKYMNGTVKGCKKLKNLKLQTKFDNLVEFDGILEGCYIKNVSFLNNEDITKLSDITLISKIIEVSQKIDFSNLINLEEIDTESGENNIVEELDLSNTKINTLDITGEYLEEELIAIEADENFHFGFK